jgi:hypothetical protein
VAEIGTGGAFHSHRDPAGSGDRESPVEIVQVSRGSWSDDVSDEEIDDDWEPSDEEPEFVQDDENGKIAVLIVW